MLKAAYAIAVVLTVGVGVASAQIPSVRTRMGLNGPVRAVHLEVRDYRWEDSRWEPMGDPVRGVTRYDRRGRCLTPHIDPGSGWRAYDVPRPPATAARAGRYEIARKGWKTVWQFDEKGRLERFEAYGVYDQGPSLAHWQQFSYDSEGRIQELTHWANTGWSPGQTEPYPPVRLKYWFDDAGRIGGWADMDDPKSRSTLTYDVDGRLAKQIDENPDGDSITYVTTRTWGGYDRRGNWTVQTITEAWRTTDGDEPHGETVLRRSITYWSRSHRHKRNQESR